MTAAIPGLALIAIWAAWEIAACEIRAARIRGQADTLIAETEEHLRKQAAR